jgi:hypothetical protein
MCFTVSAFLSRKWDRCKGGLYGNEEYETCRAETSPWMPIQIIGEFGNSNKGRAANKSPQSAVITSSDVLSLVFHLNNFTRRRARSASARAAMALRWRAPPPPPSPHRLYCFFSRSLPTQFRISRIKILISNLDMTLSASGQGRIGGGLCLHRPHPEIVRSRQVSSTVVALSGIHDSMNDSLGIKVW